MEKNCIATEVILIQSQQSLGKIQLDWMPQPGNHVDIQGETYTVLERHHQYQYKVNRYHLHKIFLYVQSAPKVLEKSWLNGRWIIGDSSCRFNAKSEIIRCAVNPTGPCDGCRYYESIPKNN